MASCASTRSRSTPRSCGPTACPLAAVKAAVQNANLDAGGRLIEMGETEFMVRGQGYIRSIEDLETAPVGLDPDHHTPILLSQVARVQLGPESRRGLVDMNGQGRGRQRHRRDALRRERRGAVIERVETRPRRAQAQLAPRAVEVHGLVRPLAPHRPGGGAASRPSCSKRWQWSRWCACSSCCTCAARSWPS